MIGTVLDVEDRKITSKRFATAHEGARAERCALPMPVVSQKFARDSIAGVYIHATAVNNLLRNDGLIEFGRIGAAISSFVLAALAAMAALAVGPVSAALATLGLAIIWIAAATAALRHALALPLIEPLLAGLAALGAAIGYRFVIADRGKRLLRQSFALYLAPALIEKMLSSNKPPALGGEMRNVTVYFSDIADFSSIAEKIPPAELVAAMNEYLSAMTDVIEAHGGFVDKYIGDAIVAVFGAPLDDPDHATNAVHAALRCTTPLGMLDRVNAAFGRTVRQRIGLNSGEALVGNIGSRRRFNYTVMGDMVNLASRLEGSNKLYGTHGHRFGGDGDADRRGIRMARARRDPGQRPHTGGADFRAAGRGGPGRAGRAVARAGLWGGPDALSCARFRPGGRAIRPCCTRRSAVGTVPAAGPAARATAAGPGLGTGE